MDDDALPFLRFGPSVPASPVVLAVPHAGRSYPPALIASAAMPLSRLETLEDRFADRLIADAVAAGTTAFVARRARAWIDLNRDERELDPAMIESAAPMPHAIGSARVRGGLGLIPRRISGGAHIYRRRLAAAEITARIESDHRPWHAADGRSRSGP
jgi:N-formylglutamate amidohydrolase